MTKSELNQKWAELEGWVKDDYYVGPDRDYHEWCENPHAEEAEYIYHAELPDWNEPNRFFAEVVPRMNDLNLKASGFQQKNGYWNISFSDNTFSLRENIGEAGLEAAIKAREEIGK